MSANPTQEQVLAEISAMLAVVLSEFGPYRVEVNMATRFTDDLEMESIDLVTLAGLLNARWGDRINFAEFIAGKRLEEIIDLRVGQLVDHVVDRLATAGLRAS